MVGRKTGESNDSNKFKEYKLFETIQVKEIVSITVTVTTSFQQVF